MTPTKLVYISLGFICLFLGFIGAFLPVLPTTPFIILAAYLFGKSSPRVHSWLTSIPYCGNAIIDWESNRVIRPKAKFMATVCILIVFSLSMFFADLAIGLQIMLAVIGAGVLIFIHTRKSHS